MRDPQYYYYRNTIILGLKACIFFFLSDTYNLLKENLFQDDAVIGEAAGIAMGLVMLGRPTVVKEMIDVIRHYKYSHQ